MPRKFKARTVVEMRMPDGGWVQHPSTRKITFFTMPEAEKFIDERIRPGEVMRVARVSSEYFIKQELVRR